MKCRICGEEFERFASHLNNKHKDISQKQYFDTYLKTNKDGKCSICKRTTEFVSIKLGYKEYCCSECAKIGGKNKAIKTFLKNYGVSNPAKSNSVKEKRKRTCLKKYGVDNPTKSKKVLAKIEHTNVKKYGCKNARCNLDVSKKIEKTNLEKYGCKNPFQNEMVKMKIKETNNLNCGCDYWHQVPEFQEVVKKANLKKWGTNYPNQTKANRKLASLRIKDTFCNRRKNNKGYLSESELEFSKLLKENGLEFTSEYFIEGKNYSHHFDFAIYRKGRLNCLIEIDGEYYHGLLSDCDGKYVRGNNDYLRWTIVPNKIKFLVIDSKRLSDGIKELLRILPMKYKKWKKEMLNSIPKRIEDAIPKFSKNRVMKDWEHLCKYKYKEKADLCKSILLNFCHSRWDSFDWKSVRKTLYKSPCSSHHLLEGLDSFKNVSILRNKFLNKHKESNSIIVKHHSPEKMLAICSLGKAYISKEPIDKESINLIKYLSLNAYEIV